MKKLLMIILLFMIQAIFAKEAEFIFIKGEVEVVTGDNKLKIKPKQNTVIKSGYVLETRDDGLAIISLSNSSIIKIDPNTILEIENLKGQNSFILHTGGVMAKIAKQKVWIKGDQDPPVEIKYKDITLGVRGTLFYVGIDQDDENLWAIVKQGRVRVINYMTDDYEDLKFGEGMFVEKGKTISSVHRYNWPLTLNWLMTPHKGVRMQSNFYSMGIRRDKEYNKMKKELLKRKVKSFKKIGSNRLKRLKSRRFAASKTFYGSRQSKKDRIINIKKIIGKATDKN